MFQNIYPDLQYAEKPQAISQKERNVKQFFPKTTKLTKDFIGKVNISKFAKSDTYVFGDEWRNSRLLIITGLLILFLTSFFGIIFMWYTDGFNNIIYSNLVITEGSPAFEMWRNPTPKPLVKVYIFNYTNVDRYEEGIDTKLNVEEKGPYVYEDTMERINIKFNGSYVSYQVKRSYRFVPELSNGRQNDIVVVPNMLMLGIAGVHRYSNFFTRLTISGGLNGYYAKPFIRIAADRYIIGYDDELYTLSKSVMRFQDKKPADKLGLLSLKVGENPDVYTMHTGLGDIDQIGTIKSWNGKTHFGYWSTKECDRVQGTDGALFSPKAVSKKKPIKFFLREFCRALDMVYKDDDTILDGDIPSYRYVLPDNIFDSPDKHPENQCFCEMDGGTCPMQGLFNTTLCAMGVPTFGSHPHFYRADPRLANAITGLNPNQSLHESFLDLHPTMGFPMKGTSRLQANIQILKTFGFSQLDKYEDQLVLPLAWFEINLEDKTLPQDMKELIATATHTVALVENLLKYGTIIIAFITLVPIVANVRHRVERYKRSDSKKSLQRKEVETEFDC